MPKRRLRSSHKTNSRAYKRVSALFGVVTHRWPAMPSARQLGISCGDRAVLVRIRKLYGEVADNLSYWSLDKAEGLLEEAETLAMAYFPQEWTAIQERRAAAELTEGSRTEARPFAA